MTTKTIDPKSQRSNPKPYQKPTLIKGPLLTNVAAQAPVSPLAPCWVARAAFGVTDLRWLIFRAWLIEDAPAWFRQFYLRHGQAIGAWLAGHAGARGIVRQLMMPVIRRKLKG